MRAGAVRAKVGVAPAPLVAGAGAGAAVAPMAYFRAVAVDFDGTLAEGGVVSPVALDAIRAARAGGVRVILVTGRIFDELLVTWPDVREHVDAIVAENGAVLITADGVRPLGPPIDAAVGEALTARRIHWRAGQVLVACRGVDELGVLEVVRAFGLDSQLVRNRDELMVLPPGITKGSGLWDVLGDLGLSHHNTIGVGDAENDHSLLATCEVGVAVANAVDSIRAHADLVLTEPDGAGVAGLLRGGLLAGRERLFPSRWQIALGTGQDGRPVILPASQLNVAIVGGPGEGKSYLAGLISEQLVGLGYSLLVIDPEGDHTGLGRLRGVLVVGGNSALGDPAELVRLVRHRYATVVVDLSGMEEHDRIPYVARLPPEIEASRASVGLPQWVVVDEAHGPVGRSSSALGVLDLSSKGYLLVTWRPDDLSADIVAGVDAVIALGTPRPSSAVVDITAAVADLPRARVARLLAGPTGRGVLAWRQRPREPVTFSITRRATPHFRHDHKYGAGGVDEARRFHFRTIPDVATGAVAANLAELEAELDRCDPGVLRHHCPRRDFSRWITQVFHDERLAGIAARAERPVAESSPAAIVEAARVALIAALQDRLRV